MNTAKHSCFDIAIVGGGISGLAMAYALTKALPTLSLALIAPETGNDPRTTAILKQHESFFADGDIWSKLQKNAQTIATVEIRSGASVTAFHARDIGQDYFSTNITNDDLRHSLQNHLKRLPNLTLFTANAARTTTHPPHHRTIMMDNGHNIDARLVIAADGANSGLRRQAAIPVKEESYDQTAAVGTVIHSNPHNNTTIEFHYNGGLLTFVPLAGANQSAIVWCKNTPATHLLTLDDITDNRLGVFSDITLSGDYPLGFLQAKKLTAERLALIGETVHKVHPLGAQGLNITLSDIQALVAAIGKFSTVGLDFGAQSCLQKYEKIRLRPMQTRTSVLHSLARQIGGKNQRDIGLLLLESHPLLKNLLARYGMEP